MTFYSKGFISIVGISCKLFPNFTQAKDFLIVVCIHRGSGHTSGMLATASVGTAGGIHGIGMPVAV